MASLAREENVYTVKLAEQAKCYEEKVKFMEKVSLVLAFGALREEEPQAKKGG